MASYHGTKNLTYDHVGKKAHKTEALRRKVTPVKLGKEAKVVKERLETHKEKKEHEKYWE